MSYEFGKRGLLGILAGALLLQGTLLAPSYAERYAPALEFPELSSETSEQEEVFTPVNEIERTSDGYAQMQVAIPQPETSLPTLKGQVGVEREFVPDVVFDDVHTIGKGERLILTIMDLVATGYSQGGDEFHARVKVPVERDGKVLIPKGALVKGHIQQADEPGKALSKRGRIVLAFDYILMPDGRKVPFKSEYNKGDNALKAVGRAIGGGIGGTITGAIRGVLVGLKFGGLQGATLTHGATLIGGGGLGALAGLENGVRQAGDHVLLNEGDEIKVALQEPLNLPAMVIPPDTVNEIQAEGLHVKVTDYSLERDPFKVENQINLKLQIDNQTAFRFGSFDIALMDEYNNVYALSPFGDTNLFFVQITPNSQLSGQFVFSVRSPDIRHYIIFYKPYTREILAKISLTEALRGLSNTPKSRTGADQT